MYPQSRSANFWHYCLLFCIIILQPASIFAHGEKIEISTHPAGPVYLNQEQATIIDLKMATVTQRAIAQLLSLNGEIQLLPNAQADVSVRISGNVSALYANLGDKVKLGQSLVKVQSLLIGDPPPSIVIKAPMTGVIDARNVNLGQAVAPNTVLFHISNRAQVITVAKVYEEDLGKVKTGQEAKVKVLSYPEQSFTGKVTLIEPNLDSLTRTVNVQILLENRQGLLKPGMFTRVYLSLAQKPTALTIPNSAILEANNEKFVFKRQDNAYERVVVKTGLSDDSYTEITAGLSAGDEVVMQGNRQLYTLWLTGGNQTQSTGDHH